MIFDAFHAGNILAIKVRKIDMDTTIKTSLKFIFEGRLERKYIFAENSSCSKIVVINTLIFSMLIETIIPRIAPIKVPKIPIIEPVKKKIRMI